MATTNLDYDFLLRYGINKLQLSLDDLMELCKSNSYTVFSYTRGADLINKFGLKKFTKYNGFTLFTSDCKIIFYKDDLSYGDKLFTIAHEIGHIYLHHTCLLYTSLLIFAASKDFISRSLVRPCSIFLTE